MLAYVYISLSSILWLWLSPPANEGRRMFLNFSAPLMITDMSRQGVRQTLVGCV